MSIWSDDPEYFDEWILRRALEGQLGQDLQRKAEEGEIEGYEIWAMKDIDPQGKLGSQATEDYCSRWGE